MNFFYCTVQAAIVNTGILIVKTVQHFLEFLVNVWMFVFGRFRFIKTVEKMMCV